MPTELQVSFVSGGKTIALDCFLPDSKHATPAVLALHGSGGGHDTMVEAARSLANLGFSVYVPHYFDRTGTVNAQVHEMFFNFPLWMKTLWDTVSLMVRQPGVDPNRIGVVGFSLGAYLALSLAGIDTRIKAVVDYFGGLPREIRPFLRQFPPTLILHGDADAVVPVAEAYSLQKVLDGRRTPYEMQIFPGEGHYFSTGTREAADLRMRAFFQKHLAEKIVSPAGQDRTLP